jgi:uncharacterized membrane protein
MIGSTLIVLSFQAVLVLGIYYLFMQASTRYSLRKTKYGEKSWEAKLWRMVRQSLLVTLLIAIVLLFYLIYVATNR